MEQIDYKQKYEEALERAKSVNIAAEYSSQKAVVEHIFPELKESEDERIRKDMIETIKKEAHDFPSSVIAEKSNSWLSWLEKQGERKPTDETEPKFRNGQWIVWQDKCYKVNYNGCGYELVDQNGLSTSLGYGTIDENAHFWDITKDAKDGDVLADDYSIIIFRKIGNHAWKDVIDYYAGYILSSGKFSIQSDKLHYGCANKTSFKPATKEQRDLLFQKMKEAGYEWNAEKKELRKVEYNPIFRVGDCIKNTKTGDEVLIEQLDIERKVYYHVSYDGAAVNHSDLPFSQQDEWKLIGQKKIKQKSIWSEEDEKQLNDIIRLLPGLDIRHNWLKSLKERIIPQQKQEWSEEDESHVNSLLKRLNGLCRKEFAMTRFAINEDEDWLKSLKEKYTWKPSDEQMKALWDSIPENVKEISEREILLDSLYQDLKKLRKE